MDAQTKFFMNQSRAALRQLLGVDRVMSEDLVRAYAQDPLYALHLWTARKAPAFLDVLLANPPAGAPPGSGPGEVEQIRNAIGAMLRWSKGGFQRVADDVYDTRLATCRACPHFDTPATPIQQLANTVLAPRPPALPPSGEPRAGTGEKTVCRLCGCVMAQKARMKESVCPDRDPANQDLSRWGAPFEAKPTRPTPPLRAAALQSEP